MAMRGKIRKKGANRQRIRNEESDESDDDYQIEDDGEFDDSDEYCSSLAGEESEDDLVRGTQRLKRKNGLNSKSKSRVGRTSSKRKVLYEEESDGDFVEDDDEEESSKNWATGFPKRKRNGVQKPVKKNKALCTEENDVDVEDYINSQGYKKLQNGVRKVVKENKYEYKEENNKDDEYEAEDDPGYDDDDYNVIEDEMELQKGCPSRKKNWVGNTLKKKKASYSEESDDNYESEDDVCEEDDDYNYSNDSKDKKNLRKNRVKKSLDKKKDSCSEESDADYECDDDTDIEDENDLRNDCPVRKQKGVQKIVKRRKASYVEDDDDDQEPEYDDYDEDNDYNDNEDGKDLLDSIQSRKKYGVKKALKENKALAVESDDDEYKAEEDECSDDDDYYVEDDEELEEDDDDEDFILDENESDNDDDIAVVEKAKKFGQAYSQGRRSGGRRRRIYSNVKSKRTEPLKRRGLKRKSSSGRCKKVRKSKSLASKTNERDSVRKRRRLVVDSDSDFVRSKPLLLEQEYTVSEEEREQVLEASKFCGGLGAALRKCSSKKRSGDEKNLHQGKFKQKTRKGKDKLEGSEIEATKQVCGICFSEEGKRTVRGTLDCCSHYFCYNCIYEWSKVESRCPLCKQRFTKIYKPNLDETDVPERDQVYVPSEEELRSYIDPYENVICTECNHGGDDANMLLCDLCDSPAHTYCVGLSEVPEGNWYCEGCRPTALGPSTPQTPRDQRTTTDLSARVSSPSENVREFIDLNRVYEPETPLGDVTGVSLYPRPVSADLRASSSLLGAGVQTVRERRRRHQQIAHFVGRSGANNIGLGPEVEWGRTRRLVSQNAINRPETTSSFYNTFPQGHSHDNFTSPVPSMGLLPTTPSHSRVHHQVWGQNLTGDVSGSLSPGFYGIMGGDAWSFHENFSNFQ